jgi:hypothetical protein
MILDLGLSYFFYFVKLLTTCGFEFVIFCEGRTFP